MGIVDCLFPDFGVWTTLTFGPGIFHAEFEWTGRRYRMCGESEVTVVPE